MQDTYEEAKLTDLAAHERTYHNFNVVTRWFAVVHAAGITALVLWFAVDAGFLAGALAAVVIGALGYRYVIRPAQNRPARHDHERVPALSVITKEPGRGA